VLDYLGSKSVVLEENMSPIPTYYRRSLSLGGLRKRRQIRVSYSPASNTVTRVEGLAISPEDVEISSELGFNLPLYVRVEGLPLFPTSYESIGTGEIIYHAPFPPLPQFHVPERSNPLSERAKVMRVTLTIQKLEELGAYSSRKRLPTQLAVMGESAQDHAQKLTGAGRLVRKSGNATWHWCHLIAFSMLPAQRAQSKQNLFCGTSAANGQMANIETCVRAWVSENKKPLGIEVTCSYLADSHLGLRLRYRLHNRKSDMSHTEYYDPLSVQQSEYDDLDAAFDRMSANLR